MPDTADFGHKILCTEFIAPSLPIRVDRAVMPAPRGRRLSSYAHAAVMPRHEAAGPSSEVGSGLSSYNRTMCVLRAMTEQSLASGDGDEG